MEREGVAETSHSDPASSVPASAGAAGPRRSKPLGQKVLLELHVQDLDPQELQVPRRLELQVPRQLEL